LGDLANVSEHAAGPPDYWPQAALSRDATVNSGFDLHLRLVRFNSAPTDFFNGQIANVQVYQRVLSASELSTVYAAGHAGGMWQAV
jgi:hypothetical protein